MHLFCALQTVAHMTSGGVVPRIWFVFEVLHYSAAVRHYNSVTLPQKFCSSWISCLIRKTEWKVTPVPSSLACPSLSITVYKQLDLLNAEMMKWDILRHPSWQTSKARNPVLSIHVEVNYGTIYWVLDPISGVNLICIVPTHKHIESLNLRHTVWSKAVAMLWWDWNALPLSSYMCIQHHTSTTIRPNHTSWGIVAQVLHCTCITTKPKGSVLHRAVKYQAVF